MIICHPKFHILLHKGINNEGSIDRATKVAAETALTSRLSSKLSTKVAVETLGCDNLSNA
jgi:hypothetical protein